MSNDKNIIEPVYHALFSKPDTNVYTILDGASVPDLPQELWEREPEYVCLYRGALEPDIAATAPYLVKLEHQAPFTKWVIAEGWSKHWGIFAVTPQEADLRTMRLHFRKFLMVIDPDGKSLYFRYYDPRVLRVYLPTCNAQEMAIVFGPVTHYVIQDEDSAVLLRFWRDGEKLQTEKLPLAHGQ
jgi:hypothetical protein